MLHVLIDTSVSVQYGKWLEMTGCVDVGLDGHGEEGNVNGSENDDIRHPSESAIGNPSTSTSTGTSSSLSTKDKLDLLQSKFHAWDRLALDGPPGLIGVQHRPSGIYDLTGGVYLLGSEDGRELFWVDLPDGEGEEGGNGGGGGGSVKWRKVRTDKAIVDMGLCVYEHELLGIVTTHPADPGSQFPPQGQGEGQEQVIELSFIHLPTNRPHRLAQVNPIVVDSYKSGSPPAIALEIVGYHLVLVLSYSFRMGLNFLFHQQQNQNQDHQGGPLDRVFVYKWTTGVLVAQFDKPARTYSSVVFLTERLFLLPNARENQLEVYRIPEVPISSRGEHYKPEMVLRLPRLSEERIISSIACRGEPAPYASSSKGKMRGKGKDLTVVSSPASSIVIFNIRILPAEMFVGFPMLGNVFTLVVQRGALVDLVDSPISMRNPTPLILPYASWGPPLTRWFTSSRIPTRWITTSASSRMVLIPSSAPDTDFGSPYMVCDFNPCAVKWTRKRKGELREVRRVVEGRLREVVRGLRGVVNLGRKMRTERERELEREFEMQMEREGKGGWVEAEWEEMRIPGGWMDQVEEPIVAPLSLTQTLSQTQADFDRAQFYIHPVDPDRDSDPDPNPEMDMDTDEDEDGDGDEDEGWDDPSERILGTILGLRSRAGERGWWMGLVVPSAALDFVPVDHPLRGEYLSLRRRYEELTEEMGRMWTVGDTRVGSLRGDKRGGGGGGRYDWEEDGEEEEEEEEEGLTDSSLLPPESQQLFDDPGGVVRGSLPYAARLSSGRYRWDGVLMDEERVLGITVSCLFFSFVFSLFFWFFNSLIDSIPFLFDLFCSVPFLWASRFGWFPFVSRENCYGRVY